MTTQPVSVIVPVGQALDRMNQILFRPFELGKWLIIGFCAWLAYLGQEGFHGNFNFGSWDQNNHFRHDLERARDFVLDNLFWIVPLAAAIVVLSIGLGLLFLWLSSRGHFMFLRCVALDKAEVAEPWNQFAVEGNSLFWFRLVLGLIGFALMLPPLVLASLMGIRMAMRETWTAQVIFVLLALGCGILLIALALLLVRKFTLDFVVPIMFLRRKRCLAAWSEFMRLLGANAFLFILYVLFQIVMSLAIAVLVFALVLMTCCLAGCLLVIPYLGTVFLLPLLVFKRSYSLCYLAQFGDEFNVFASPARVSSAP